MSYTLLKYENNKKFYKSFGITKQVAKLLAYDIETFDKIVSVKTTPNYYECELKDNTTILLSKEELDV